MPPPPPGGAPPMGGDMPGGDPSGMPPADPMGGGMPPMGGGGMGGDPMGGGAPPATPVPVQTISVADVWKVLRRVVDDTKYDSFFDEINVSHLNPKLSKVNKSNTPKSLLK